MISLFKYFTYAQMALIAVLAIGFIVQCFLNGGQFHLYIMIFIVLSLFGNKNHFKSRSQDLTDRKPQLFSSFKITQSFR